MIERISSYSSSSSSSFTFKEEIPREDGVAVHRGLQLRNIGILFGWQFLSMLLTFMSIFSQFISDNGIRVPNFQSFLGYSLIFLFNFSFYVYRSGSGNGSDRIRSNIEWWKYLFVSLIDVEGNFLIVLAFQFTNMVSVQLLDCFAIPCVMALTVFFHKVKYGRWQYFGAILCIMGLIGLVLIDAKYSDSVNSRHPAGVWQVVWGDFLAIIGASLYALSDFCQEIIAKASRKSHNSEYIGQGVYLNEMLAFMGGFGMLISGIQSVLLGEWHDLVNCSLDDWLYLCGFGATMFVLYFFVPRLLMHSNAAVMNLSFLSSDFWSVIAASLIFGVSFHLVYFLPFIAIIFGVTSFHTADMNYSVLENEISISQLDEEDFLN